jgi:molybdenum cofactor guanylyltransferase
MGRSRADYVSNRITNGEEMNYSAVTCIAGEILHRTICGYDGVSRATHMNSGAIVLCGGKSTRMGASKALLPFGPETMLQRVVRLLETVVSPIVVVAAAEQDLPLLPHGVIVTRDEEEGRGPLEGLRAGLKALPANVDAAYVTSCDVPLLVPGFVRQMLDLCDDHDVAVIEIDGFTHPLSAVYRRTVLTHVEELLAHDRLRPAFLFDRVKTRRVRPDEISVDPELRTLRNLNTRQDYEQALADAGVRST